MGIIKQLLNGRYSGWDFLQLVMLWVAVQIPWYENVSAFITGGLKGLFGLWFNI